MNSYFTHRQMIKKIYVRVKEVSEECVDVLNFACNFTPRFDEFVVYS